MRFLIIADPIEKLIAASDTGLSVLREALARNHTVYWATSQDLQLYQNSLLVRTSRVSRCEPAKLPELQPQEEGVRIDSFDGVWIRKDPPFDPDYLSLCWLLALEEEKVPMLNPPSRLLRYHEKMLPFEALQQGFITEQEMIPTYLVSGEEHTIPNDFPAGPIISKPWFGYAGRDIEKWNSIQDALDSAYGPAEHYTLFQSFLARVTETGDRRVFFIDGEYCGDVLRLPQQGSILANLAQGGIAELRDMTAQEKDLTKRVGHFLKSIGILIAGADYIDGRLTEINITAPTGFEALATLGQANPSVQYLDLAEALAKEKKR